MVRLPPRSTRKESSAGSDVYKRQEQPLSGHSFRVGAALDLLEQGEGIEKIMRRGGWQTDSTAMKYLRNWMH